MPETPTFQHSQAIRFLHCILERFKRNLPLRISVQEIRGHLSLALDLHFTSGLELVTIVFQQTIRN